MFHRVVPIALFLLAGTLAAQEASQEAPYEIRPGDRLTTTLFTAAGTEVQVVKGARIVDRNGNVYLPLVGSLHVSGLDETKLRELLTREYARYYDSPVLDLKVELRVNVTGSVFLPGQYFLDPTATIIDALASARGATPDVAVTSLQIPSDPGAVRLVRDGETIVLNLRPDEVTEEVLKMRVRSGDWIHVPTRGRSRVRDEITFWGSVVSFATSIVALLILSGR